MTNVTINTKESFIDSCIASDLLVADRYGNFKYEENSEQFRIKPMKTSWKLETKVGKEWKRLSGASYKKGELPVILQSTETVSPSEGAEKVSEPVPFIHPDLQDMIEGKHDSVNVDTETFSGKDLIQLVVANADGANTVWDKTGIFIMTHRGRFASDAKGNRKVLYGLLDASADAAKVPTMGINNKGEEINLRKKDGSVKWAAWDKFRRFTQNMADIFGSIEIAGWDEVFPNGKLAPRHVIQALKKGNDDGPKEAPIETFKRSILLAEKKLEEIGPDDKALVQEMLVSLNAKWAEFSK